MPKKLSELDKFTGKLTDEDEVVIIDKDTAGASVLISLETLRDFMSNWEYENICVRGVRGGGYAGSTSTSFIHQILMAQEICVPVMNAGGNVTMQFAKHYGCGLSSRTHGYFIALNFKTADMSDMAMNTTDKFQYATNTCQMFEMGLGTLSEKQSSPSFSDERRNVGYVTQSISSAQIAVILMAADQKKTTLSSSWTHSAAGGGFGYWNENKGWMASGAHSNTSQFTFATNTFVNLPVSCRDGADVNDYDNGCNTRKGFGYKISTNGGTYQNKAHKFNYTTETWSNIPDCPYQSETQWHGGFDRGYSSGSFDAIQNNKGAIITYATDVAAYAPQLNAPIAICSSMAIHSPV